MIGIYRGKIASIPSLIVVDANKESQALPTIIYFHGFTSAKEHNLPLAYLLAEKGFRVVLPDSHYHGEREEDVSEVKKQISFWNIVMQNVQELEKIKDALDEKGLIQGDNIGVAGTSMGGITTSAALARYPWIKVAGILMGSPKITTYAKTLVASFKKTGTLPITDEEIDQLYGMLEDYDLSMQPEKLNQRPLLFWHGDHDPVVPFDHSYTFYESIQQHYDNKEDIHFIKEENHGHKVSRHAILETVKWFEKFLIK